MRMKRFVSVLAAAVMVFGVTGCNAITIDGETENVSGEAAGNGSIGFSVSTLNNPFFVTLSEGAKEKAKTEGEKLIVVDAGDDAAKQTSDIEEEINGIFTYDRDEVKFVEDEVKEINKKLYRMFEDVV